jgi:hypothetical protein
MLGFKYNQIENLTIVNPNSNQMSYKINAHKDGYNTKYHEKIFGGVQLNVEPSGKDLLRMTKE